MNIKDDNGEMTSKKILDWLTGIITLAAAFSTIIGVFFSDDRKAQQFAYIAAFVLIVVSGAIYFYQRLRAAKLKITESLEPLSASAALRGLLPFEEGDQLPGRARDVQELYTLVASSAFRFGVLWGESGCGKTSLLRAGLTPKLRNEKFIPLYINKPTKDPQEAIRSALTKEVLNLEKHGNKNLKQLLGRTASKGKTIVILFDQFEEFFLTNRTPSSRMGFVKWLGEVVNDESLPVAFLIGIRADFFAQLQNFAPQIPEPTSARSTYQLQNFDTEQAKQIFSAAAKVDGIPFEPALIQAVVKELETEEFIRPAELQVVGTRLKRRNIFNLNKYEALGGARGILSSYIGDEIKQSQNQQAARLILRLMCADIVETKSQTDLSLDDILHGVSGTEQSSGEKTTGRPEEIQAILRQFVNARVLIHTDEDKYNLVHDYLAPYVRTATEGAETSVEHANRLLKRYVAEYKEDPKTRIPIGRIRWLQKHASAEVRNSEKPRELIKKSKEYFYSIVVGAVSIPIVLITFLYVFLTNSYYMGLESFTNSDSYPLPHIVVRTGHPQLRFVPGFGKIIVQTDFTMSDFSSDTKALEALLRDNVTGFRFEKTEEGYQKWGDQLILHLNSSPQARMHRWLNQPELGMKILIDTISDSEADPIERNNAAAALSEFAQINPQIVTADLLQTLIDIISNKETDISVRSGLVNTLKQLTQANTQMAISPDLFQELMEVIADPEVDASLRSATINALVQIIQINDQPALAPTLVDKLVVIIREAKTDLSLRASATGNLKQLFQYPQAVTPDLMLMLVYSSDTPASVRSSSADILGSLAQFNPKSITPNLFQSLMSYAVDSQMDLNIRSNIQSILIQRAQVNPQIITPDLMKTPLTLITNKYYIDPSLRNSTQDTFIKLALANPQAITSDFLQSMVDFIMYLQGDGAARISIRNSALTQLAQANPKAVTPELLQKLTDIFFDTEADPYERDWAGYTLQPLIAANPNAVAPDTFERLIKIIADPQAIDLVRSKAEYAIGPLATANPKVVTREELKLLTVLIIDQKANSNVDMGATDALVKFAKANPDTITPDIVQSLVLAIVNLQTNASTRTNAANALLQLTLAKPQVLTPELFQMLIGFIIDAKVDATIRTNTGYVLAQMAQANPKVVTPELLQRLIDLIVNPKVDTSVRSSAGYALGQISRVNSKAVNPEMLQALLDVISDPTVDTAIRSETASAFGQLAQANPKAVNFEMLQTLMDIVTDPNTDVIIRYRVTSALGQFAQANSEFVTPELLQTYMDIVSDPKLKGFIPDPKGELSVRASAAYTLASLAQANLQFVTPDLLQTLVDVITDSEMAPDALSNLTYALGIFAQTNPKVVTPELFQMLVDFIANPKVDSTIRSTAVTVLVQLAQANPKIITSELLQELMNLITSSKTETDSSRSNALTSWVQLAKANPKAITPELLQALANLIAQSKADTDTYYLRSAAVTAIRQLAQANPKAVTPELLLIVTDLVIDTKADLSVRSDLAKVLGKLAQVNPQATEKAKTVLVLMDLLKTDTDSTGRSTAAYAIFEITLKDESQGTIIRKELSDNFLTSPKPHLRIAANRLLEMMEVGVLAKETTIHPDETENIKLRLSNLAYNNYTTDEHLQYAASVALEEINKLEIEKQNNIFNSQP